MKFATKLFRYYLPHLMHVATLHYLGKLKIQIFCIHSADMEENANKLHFKCIDFNSSAHVTVYAECIYVFLSKWCPRRWIPCMLFVDTYCSDVWCDQFPVPQIDRKSKQVKEQCYEKIYLQSVWGRTRYVRHRKYQNLWMNNKVRGDKM